MGGRWVRGREVDRWVGKRGEVDKVGGLEGGGWVGERWVRGGREGG